jgi:hypothetical protein
MVFRMAAVLEMPEQLRDIWMQRSRLKKSASDVAASPGTQRQRQQAWIDMLASGVLLSQVGAAPETPLRGKLSEISLDGGSIEESIVTMQARSAQSIAELAVGNAALRDNAKSWKLAGEPNHVTRVLCIQVPREMVRRHVEDRAAEVTPLSRESERNGGLARKRS